MKKLLLLTKTLLAAALLCVGQNAWGAPTSYLTTWTGSVGTDNSADLYYGTKKVKIAAGETYVFTLKNLNDGGADTWHNWVVEGNSGGKYFDCCANGDNWPFGDGAPTPSYTPVMATTDVADFMTKYNGATVTVTISRNGAGDQITVVHTSDVLGTTDGNTDKYYGGTYTVAVGAEEEWDVYITQRYSHFVVTNVVYTESDGTTTHTYTPAIEALPFSKAWIAKDTTYPFVGGDIVSGTNVNAFRVSNTTATASFDTDPTTDGNQPYTLGTDETVTLSFTAYFGYVGGSTTSTVELLNSEGVALASFTYAQGSSNVTDVSFGGTTVAGFESFKGRSSYNATKDGNGFAPNSYAFVNNAGYNPVVTMTVSDNGYVSLRYYTANGVNAVDKNYNTTLPTSGVGAVKMDIASIRIVDGNSNADRAIGINNLSITSAIAPKADVTFAYEDTDGNSLASIKSNYVLENVAVGANIADIIPDALKETFYNGDASYKYVYSTFASGDTEVQEGGSTVTLKFDARQKFNFTANAKDADENNLGIIASGFGYAKESTTFYIPACVLNDGKLYFTTNEAYEKSETLTSDGQVLSYAYSTSTVDNVVFFSEGESLTSSTVTTPGFKSLASNGVVGRGSNLDVTNLEAGKYTVYVKYYNSTSSKQTLLVKAGDVDVINDNAVSARPTKSGSVTLTESTAIKLTATGASNSGVDYLYIVKSGDVVKLNANGYATYSAKNDVEVSGAEAYTAVLDYANSIITCTKIASNKVPAGKGVLLYGDANADVTLSITADAAALSTNNLKATTLADGTLATKGSNNYYALDGDTFKQYTGAAFVHNKAYFEVEGSNVLARSMSIVLGDKVTGVENVEAAAEAKAQEGKFIENGKLVIVKNGQKFNAAGAKLY